MQGERLRFLAEKKEPEYLKEVEKANSEMANIKFAITKLATEFIGLDPTALQKSMKESVAYQDLYDKEEQKVQHDVHKLVAR